MFIRYTAFFGPKKPAEPAGLFVAAYELKEQMRLTAELQQELEERLLWFQRHVRPIPIDELDSTEQQAVCWYKPAVVEAIAQTRALALFLEARGLSIQIRQTSAPGVIIHADEWQVAAIPARTCLHSLSLRAKIWWRRNVPTFD